MIDKTVIEQIYKQFAKRPRSKKDIDLGLLFERTGIEHDLNLDPDTNELIVMSIPEDSPFHRLSIDNIMGIVPFEEWTAIVLHSSIVFLNNLEPKVSINLRPHKESIWEKIGLSALA